MTTIIKAVEINTVQDLEEFEKRRAANINTLMQFMGVPTLLALVYFCYLDAYAERYHETRERFTQAADKLKNYFLYEINGFDAEVKNNHVSTTDQLENLLLPGQPITLNTFIEVFGIIWSAGAPVPYYLAMAPLVYGAIATIGHFLTKYTTLDFREFEKKNPVSLFWYGVAALLAWQASMLISMVRFNQFKFHINIKNLFPSLVPDWTDISLDYQQTAKHLKTEWLQNITSSDWYQTELLTKVPQFANLTKARQLSIFADNQTWHNYTLDLTKENFLENGFSLMSPGHKVAFPNTQNPFSIGSDFLSKVYYYVFAKDCVISPAYLISFYPFFVLHALFLSLWLFSYCRDWQVEPSQEVEQDRHNKSYFQEIEAYLTENNQGIRLFLLLNLIPITYYAAGSSLWGLVNILPLTDCDISGGFFAAIAFILKNLIVYQNGSWNTGKCDADDVYLIVGSNATNPTTIISVIVTLLSPFILGIPYLAYRYFASGRGHGHQAFSPWLYESVIKRFYILESDAKYLQTAFRGSLTWAVSWALFSYLGVGWPKAVKTGGLSLFQTIIEMLKLPNTPNNVSIKSGFISSFIFSILYSALIVSLPVIITYMFLIGKKLSSSPAYSNLDGSSDTIYFQRDASWLDWSSSVNAGLYISGQVIKSILKAGILTAMFYFPLETVFDKTPLFSNSVFLATIIGVSSSIIVSRVFDFLNKKNYRAYDGSYFLLYKNRSKEQLASLVRFVMQCVIAGSVSMALFFGIHRVVGTTWFTSFAAMIALSCWLRDLDEHLAIFLVEQFDPEQGRPIYVAGGPSEKITDILLHVIAFFHQQVEALKLLNPTRWNRDSDDLDPSKPEDMAPTKFKVNPYRTWSSILFVDVLKTFATFSLAYTLAGIGVCDWLGDGANENVLGGTLFAGLFSVSVSVYHNSLMSAEPGMPLSSRMVFSTIALLAISMFTINISGNVASTSQAQFVLAATLLSACYEPINDLATYHFRK